VIKIPISICSTKGQVEKWAKAIVHEGKFIIYLTLNNEVVVEPLRSTRPLRYCYYKGSDFNDAKKVAESISKAYNLSIVEVSSMSWDNEKGPWVKVIE